MTHTLPFVFLRTIFKYLQEALFKPHFSLLHFSSQMFIIKISSTKYCKCDMENYIHFVYHIFITFFMPKNSNDYVFTHSVACSLTLLG